MSDTQDTLVEQAKRLIIKTAAGTINCETLVGYVEEFATALADRDAQVAELTQKLERAKEALKPFATEADQWEGFSDDENLVEMWNGGPATNLTVAHLREARTARAFLDSGASQNG